MVETIKENAFPFLFGVAAAFLLLYLIVAVDEWQDRQQELRQLANEGRIFRQQQQAMHQADAVINTTAQQMYDIGG